MKVDFDKIFAEYERRYNEIFAEIYPAKNSTGFQERNLSVNFSKAYETVAAKQGRKVVTWFEFQFGAKNNKHIDAIILDKEAKALLLIEAKRYSVPARKIPSVGRDIERIKELLEELSRERPSRIYISEYEHIYGLILADVWLQGEKKKAIYKAYKDKEFLRKYSKEMGNIALLNEEYFIQEYPNISNYKQVSFLWEIDC